LIWRIADATCIPALNHNQNNWSSYFHLTPKVRRYKAPDSLLEFLKAL
jgi:hypothetical protein